MDLARRNFRMLVLYTVSQYVPLYWPYMYHLVCEVRGLSGQEFGWLKSVYYAGVVVGEVPAGVLADRLGGRLTLLLGALFNAAGCFLYVGGRSFWTFALAEGL